jgi:hypothetical protein
VEQTQSDAKQKYQAPSMAAITNDDLQDVVD